MQFDKSFFHLIDEALREDVGDGDHSTLCCIPADAKGKAVLKIKQDGIIAGIRVASEILCYKDPGAVVEFYKEDGETMKQGDIAFKVQGSIHTILTCERVVLNCMQRMSGIATLTREYVNRLKGYKTRLLDTRKTTPNFRLLEKEAVRIGGGINHRFGLYDMIMLKDNHIDYAGGIEKAINMAHDYVCRVKPDLCIEVEARSLDDVRIIAEKGKGKVFRIMLDNFTPDKIKEALTIMQGGFESEASGGINLENLDKYAETGVDFISIGALIHQARSLDLSLKAVIPE